jgi:hypothetical protein
MCHHENTVEYGSFFDSIVSILRWSRVAPKGNTSYHPGVVFPGLRTGTNRGTGTKTVSLLTGTI